VRICKGCLKGIEGVLVEIRGSERFVVAVTFMNQGSSIEALPGNIEPLMS